MYFKSGLVSHTYLLHGSKWTPQLQAYGHKGGIVWPPSTF